MKMFNEKGQCQKCGSNLISATHIIPSDLIQRRCNRCGYEWKEAPLDRTNLLDAR